MNDIILPEILFTEENSIISNEAKLLYGYCMAQLAEGIVENDEDGNIFVEVAQNFIIEFVQCAKDKARIILDELKDHELIEKSVIVGASTKIYMITQ